MRGCRYNFCDAMTEIRANGGKFKRQRSCCSRERASRRRVAQTREGFRSQSLEVRRTLPDRPPVVAVVRQLAKSGPSVSANYHSAGRARSRAEFISRLGIVVDEADKTVGWLEILKESSLASGAELDCLIDESRQLRAIFLQCLKTAKLNDRRHRQGP